MFGFEHFGKEMWVRFFAGLATPPEVRSCSGQFALMPLMLLALGYLGPYCFSNIDSVGGVLFFVGLLIVGCLWLTLWVKLIPARLSWVLGWGFWLAAFAWAFRTIF